MDLDLGSKPEANVKVGSDVYKMSVPTVKQSIKFSKDMDACEDEFKKTEMFVTFISQLGMPEEVAESLSVQQMSKLAEGLIGNAEKK